jgi:poly(A) polymerase
VPLSPVLLGKRTRKLDIIRRLENTSFAGTVLLVGGALRELALGKGPHDYDFALEDRRDIAVFEAVLGSRSFVLGKKPIQTSRIVTPEISIDITDLEGTTESDLLRRDFTMNAMAYDVRERVFLDPLGGLVDIENRTIRYPRKESVQDDPLRMIKAARHLSALPGFILDDELKRAMANHRPLIARTAPERIRYEFDLMMASVSPARGIDALRETGLLFEIFPELLPLGQLDREQGFTLETLGHTLDGFRYVPRVGRFHGFTERERRLACWGLLFHDLGKPLTFSRDPESGKVHFFYHERHSRDIAGPIMDRLRFSTADTRAIAALIENHMRLFLISTKEATDRATRRVVYRMENLTPSLVFLTLLDLYGSSRGKDNVSTRRVRQTCRQVLSAYGEWSKKPLPRLITGRDLLTLGYSEGPTVGLILGEVREKQIAGDMTEKEEALEYARQRLSDSTLLSG